MTRIRRRRLDRLARRRRQGLSQISGGRQLRHQPDADLRPAPGRRSAAGGGAGRRRGLRATFSATTARSISDRRSSSRASARRRMSARRSARSTSPSRRARLRRFRRRQFPTAGRGPQGSWRPRRLGRRHHGRFRTARRRHLRVHDRPAARWGDNDYQDAYFGVTPGVAAATGLPVFDADGGFYSVGVYAGLTYMLSRNWGLYTYAGYDRLVGDAADRRSCARSDRATSSPAGSASSTASTPATCSAASRSGREPRGRRAAPTSATSS